MFLFPIVPVMEITAAFLESVTGQVSVSQQGRLCPGESSAGELSLTGNVELLRDIAANANISSEGLKCRLD